MDFFTTNFMLQSPLEDDHHQLSTSLAPCSFQNFHGVGSVVGKRSLSFSGIEETNHNGDIDDMSDDDGSQLGGEKKIRRLNMEQVKTLEKNFELGNKLEPERKLQLARALGLQPRRIAIWFQNRRARWKTKQLERDYQILKRQFEAIKADNDALQAQNHNLHAQILALKSREPVEPINLNKETEGCSSNRSENSSDIKLGISSTPAIDRPLFPTSMKPIVMTQLFHESSKADLHCQKIDQTVKEESFTNMFCGIDDQSGFWPWLEQPQYN